MKFVVFILTVVGRFVGISRVDFCIILYISSGKKVLLSYNFQLIQLIKEMFLKSFIVTISCPTNQRDSTNQKKQSHMFLMKLQWDLPLFGIFLGMSWG